MDERFVVWAKLNPIKRWAKITEQGGEGIPEDVVIYDDPATINLCLRCTLPDDACDSHEDCPFIKARRQKDRDKYLKRKQNEAVHSGAKD